jgi:hypothetical protein
VNRPGQEVEVSGTRGVRPQQQSPFVEDQANARIGRWALLIAGYVGCAHCFHLDYDRTNVDRGTMEEEGVVATLAGQRHVYAAS